MEIDVKNILPPDLQIPEAGSHLYRIGLSLFPYGYKPRYRLCNPILIWIIMLTQLIKSCVSLIINNKKFELFLFIGDLGYFLNIKKYMNLTIITIIFGSQLLIIPLLYHYIIYIIIKKA